MGRRMPPHRGALEGALDVRTEYGGDTAADDLVFRGRLWCALLSGRS